MRVGGPRGLVPRRRLQTRPRGHLHLSRVSGEPVLPRDGAAVAGRRDLGGHEPRRSDRRLPAAPHRSPWCPWSWTSCWPGRGRSTGTAGSSPSTEGTPHDQRRRQHRCHRGGDWSSECPRGAADVAGGGDAGDDPGLRHPRRRLHPAGAAEGDRPGHRRAAHRPDPLWGDPGLPVPAVCGEGPSGADAAVPGGVAPRGGPLRADAEDQGEPDHQPDAPPDVPVEDERAGRRLGRGGCDPRGDGRM